MILLFGNQIIERFIYNECIIYAHIYVTKETNIPWTSVIDRDDRKLFKATIKVFKTTLVLLEDRVEPAKSIHTSRRNDMCGTGYGIGFLHDLSRNTNRTNESSFPDLLIDINASKDGEQVRVQLKGNPSNGRIALSDAAEITYGANPKQRNYTELFFTLHNGKFDTTCTAMAIIRNIVKNELGYSGLGEIAEDVKFCVGEVMGNAIEFGPKNEAFETGMRLYDTHLVAWVTENSILPKYKEPSFDEISSPERERGRGRWFIRQYAHIVADEIEGNKTTTIMYWDLARIITSKDSQRMREMLAHLPKAA